MAPQILRPQSRPGIAFEGSPFATGLHGDNRIETTFHPHRTLGSEKLKAVGTGRCRPVAAVLIFKLERMSRNIDEWGPFRNFLKKHGCRLESATEDLPFGYAYDKNTQALSPHAEEAPVVRRIFEQTAQLTTLENITDALNHEGLRTRARLFGSAASVRRRAASPPGTGSQRSRWKILRARIARTPRSGLRSEEGDPGLAVQNLNRISAPSETTPARDCRPCQRHGATGNATCPQAAEKRGTIPRQGLAGLHLRPALGVAADRPARPR